MEGDKEPMSRQKGAQPRCCAYLAEAAEAFGAGRNSRITALGEGNIHDTFRVDGDAGRIVLQRINASVFSDPVKVVLNAARTAAHIAASGRAEDMRVAEPLKTSGGNGCYWYRDKAGAVWRAQRYIAGTRVLRAVENCDQAREIGGCLAAFHEAVDDLKTSHLPVVLPGFHDLPAYLRAYDRAVAAAPAVSAAGGKDLLFCRQIIGRLRGQATFFVAAQRRGDLVQRVVHGDPKVSNILFDADGGAAVAMIDLDTVGAGLVLQDLGDCLRSCCSRVGEDGDGLHAACDPAVVAAVMQGYLRRRSLSSFERRSLYPSLLLITFELGVRFLTDHLQGDSYFRVKEAGDNLRRAAMQFRLAASIENEKQAIEESVAAL